MMKQYKNPQMLYNFWLYIYFSQPFKEYKVETFARSGFKNFLQ